MDFDNCTSDGDCGQEEVTEAMSEASLLYLIFSINILGLADRDRETKRGEVKAVDSVKDTNAARELLKHSNCCC